MMWGVVVGTYSSLFIAAPMLYYIRPQRGGRTREKAEAEDEVKPPAKRPPVARPAAAKPTR
jgi:preprotein translocase subunit SecF